MEEVEKMATIEPSPDGSTNATAMNDPVDGYAPRKAHFVMDVHTLMAPSFVPNELQQIFQVPCMTLWAAQELPNSLSRVQFLFRSSVVNAPICFCDNRVKHKVNEAPWMNLSEVKIDVQLALQQHHKGYQRFPTDFNGTFTDVEVGVNSLADYVGAFARVLQAEFEENVILYDRYTQYNLTVVPRLEWPAGVGDVRSTMISRAILEIPGILDARPALKPGDRVLLRPMIPFGVQWNEPVEIQATIVNTVRAANQRQKDRVIITWLSKERINILGPRKMAVRFFPSTTDPDRCMTALNWLNVLDPKTSKGLLFPSQPPKVQVVKAVAGILDNSRGRDLWALNSRQYQFVKMVVSRSADPTTGLIRPPMILTGPAGTGKTKTMLTALLKCLELDDQVTGAESISRPTKRVLLCTPSHTACDVVTRRLSKHLNRKRLFRLYDASRPVETVPVEMLGFTLQNSMGEFVLPSVDDILHFQVVVCTCTDAHLLFLSGLTNHSLRNRRQCLRSYITTTFSLGGIAINMEGVEAPHFTHLFIDEAAQATEPEVMIPFSVVVDDAEGIPKVEIALSGDPRQLNPDIYNRFACAPLQKSYLERLLRLPEFGGRTHLLGPPTKDTWRSMDELVEYSFQGDENETGEQNLAVFLDKSFRGHPSFLHMPSKLFYLGKLTSVHPVDTLEESTWCRALRILEARSQPAYACSDKKLSWPIHFIGVIGMDVSLAVESFWGSNSWCNREEALSVADAVESLCRSGVTTQSIGVMAAFRAQVLYIRRLLRSRNLDAVSVGLVEDYQAVERDVIIVSLTRSNEQFVPADIERNAGLFQQPRRVNVALTRAENLLVVVGNPNTMKKDPLWSTWLEYCQNHGFWYGEGTSRNES